DWKRLLVLERFVLSFLVRLAIEGEIALELHDRTGGAEQIAAATDVRLLDRRNIEVDGRRVEHRRRHLRRHEALPDQLIKLELVRREMTLDELRPPRRIRRPNALVRVLRVFLV